MKELSKHFGERSKFITDMQTDTFVGVVFFSALAALPFSPKIALLALATPTIYQGLNLSQRLVSGLIKGGNSGNDHPSPKV